jgi:hypothetical protein
VVCVTTGPGPDRLLAPGMFRVAEYCLRGAQLTHYLGSLAVFRSRSVVDRRTTICSASVGDQLQVVGEFDGGTEGSYIATVKIGPVTHPGHKAQLQSRRHVANRKKAFQAVV